MTPSGHRQSSRWLRPGVFSGSLSRSNSRLGAPGVRLQRQHTTTQHEIGEPDGRSHSWLGRIMMHRVFVAPADITDTRPSIDTKDEGRSPCPAAVFGSKPVSCFSPALVLPVHLLPAAASTALGVSSSSLGPELARRPFATPWLSPMELLPMVATARPPCQVAWPRPGL